MKLETRIKELLGAANDNSNYTVIAHELNRDQGNWSTNDTFIIGGNRYLSFEEMLITVRKRWEIFKIMYHSKARVKDIEYLDCSICLSLEVNHIPFVDIYVYPKTDYLVK
jgi:hypothetical protein